MITKARKLTRATIGNGASSAAITLAIAVAIAGLWFVGIATGDHSPGVHVASIR